MQSQSLWGDDYQLRGEYLMGLKVGGKGEVTKNVLWRNKYTSKDSATPVSHEGKVDLLADRVKTGR